MILHLWLRGEHLGEVEQLRNGRPRLRFSDEAIERYGAGAAPLSLSLPIGPKRAEGGPVEAFLDGLLPEGAVREQLNREHGARTAFDLLRHIGAECAGAVQFSLEDQPPGDGHLRELTEAEVDRMIVALPTLAVPEGEALGASLGGIQAKLLLTRTPTGWAWPSEGAMSTHILKPQPNDTSAPAQLIDAEFWAMQVAGRAGLRVANTQLDEFDGRPTIVVERFDREGGRRTHQEDLTQALGLSSRSKYEGTLRSERRLARVAESGAANADSPRLFLDELLSQVTFNAIIGNGDAHSKNYSLAIDPAALYFPTPLYDVAPVLFLGPYRHTGHAINGQVDLRYITTGHLIAEAANWGMSARVASDVVGRVIDAVALALPEVEPPQGLEEVARDVSTRVRGFADQR
jgi:serine/threonine-protein kinase HipA